MDYMALLGRLDQALGPGVLGHHVFSLDEAMGG